VFECKCGKKYKREDFYKKHIKNCFYYDMDENKIIYIGEKVLECFDVYFIDRKLLKECLKQNNNKKEECYKLVRKEFILKYKKMFWEIYKKLTASIPNRFLKSYFCWLKRNYKFDNKIIGLKTFVLNNKRLYRYIIEHLYQIVLYQIDKDLTLISDLYNEVGKINEILIEELIVNKEVSYYFIVLNDIFVEIAEKNGYFKSELDYISDILLKIDNNKLNKIYKMVNKNNKVYFYIDSIE